MESSQFESSSGVVPKTTLLFYENFGPLFDLICADYVTARYASEENAKRVFYGALKKLYLTIHAESSILPLPSAANHLPILCADHDFQYKAHIRYEKLSKALQNASKQPDAFYSEEVCIRQVLKEHLKRFVDEIVQKKAFRKLLHEELPTPDFLPHEDAFPASFSASASAAAVHLISPPPLYGEIRMEGWLRKKGQHVNFWRERYFMIRSSTNGTHYLCYFRKKGDREPRGWYVLGPGTLVDDVRESPSKIETKKLFTFRISNYTHTSFDEAHLDEMCPSHGLDVPLTRSASGLREGQAILENQANGTFVSENEEGLRRKSSGTFRSRAAAAAAAATAATAVVLTGGLAGVGIGVGMGMSAAAAAAASASAAGAYMNQQQGRQHGTVALAAESYETAIWWRNSVLDCILQAEEQWRQYLQWYMDQQTSEPLEHLQTSTKPRSGSFGTIPRSLARSSKRTFSKKASWKLYAFSSQLRVYKEHPSTTVSSLPPAFRTSLKVDASPKAVFDAIMHTNSSFYIGNHIIQDANVVEAHEKDHSDIVCWKLAPIFLWPVYTAPRELCLLRYWRKEQDESFFICFQSTSHSNCPVSKDAVRATMLGGGFTLSPSIDGSPGCWVTLTSQLNPNGYIDTAPGRSWHFMSAYATQFLQIISHLQSLTYTATHIRDKVHIDSPKLTHPSKIQLLPALRTELSVRHCLATKYWSEPCAQSFLVRGEQYRSSGIKVPSERQAFRLFGVVLFGSETPIERIGTAGIEGLSGRIDSPTQSWVWIVHLMLPGPPFHSLVLYFTLEDSNFLRKSPSNLCHAFMQGPSDTFRQDRLKVIPRVEQGSRSIRNGIGTTPTILGRKMYQQYHREAQCLEIDYDITSSSVASEMTKLLLGCCDRLVVDLAFVIEGKTDDELPERVLGTVRLRNVTLSDAVPFGGAGERSDL